MSVTHGRPVWRTESNRGSTAAALEATSHATSFLSISFHLSTAVWRLYTDFEDDELCWVLEIRLDRIQFWSYDPIRISRPN